MIPDAPIGHFRLTLFGGKQGYGDFREKFLIRDAEANMSTTPNPGSIMRAIGGGVNNKSTFGLWLDQNLYAGAKFSPAFAGTKVPTFDEALDLAKGKINVYVDTKYADPQQLIDTIVRHELQRFGGREVNTAGDGFVATFSSPSAALACADEIIDSVHVLGIEVRVGIHAGEVEVRGADVAGMAVHIGARVAALAGPSEVLVSSTVRDIVTGSRHRFDDRGESGA